MERIEVPVAVDFDGVVADSEYAKITFARKELGIEDLSPPIKRKSVVEQKKIMTLEQYRFLQQKVGGKWEYGRLMVPVPGVLLVIPKLCYQGCPLSIVTSRTDEDGYKLLFVAIRWLKMWELFWCFQNILGAGYKQSKAPVIEQIQPKPLVYLDDDFDKLLPLIGVVEHLFLLSREHNLDDELPSGIERVESWEGFYNKVCKINSESVATAAR